MLSLKSLSVVGLAKNAGKTETLNYIIKQIAGRPIRVALTSIGIDGERTDQVTQTEKPEIVIPAGMSFVTSESHYLARQLTSTIYYISQSRTSLGRLVAARSILPGKVLLSGPASTYALKQLIRRLQGFDIDLTIVDGALSRLSLASPSVTEGMVLATGASVSSNISELVRQTAFVYHLIDLPQADAAIRPLLENIDKGVWAIDDQGVLHDLNLPSVFLIKKAGKDIFKYGHRLYVAGAVSDMLLNILRAQNEKTELIVQDFTKIFATPRTFYTYEKMGGRISVVDKSRLLAITINPQAPSGYLLDSVQLENRLSEALQLPVYDVRRLQA